MCVSAPVPATQQPLFRALFTGAAALLAGLMRINAKVERSRTPPPAEMQDKISALQFGDANK